MESAALRRSLPKERRNGEVDLARNQFTKVVKTEGRLVGDDRLRLVIPPSAPEEESNKVVMLGTGEPGNAIEAMPGSLEVPSLEVVDEVREVVACFFGLFGREIATLGYG
jgi:hypothetical protein